MIFQPQLARAVVEGRKTQTRRPVKSDKPCRYRVGHDYAVQPGRGKSAICRMKVLSVREEPVGAITHPDARAEGFRNAAAFKAYWVQIHDARWVADYMEANSLDALSEPFLLERFEAKHAHKLVWVIEFTLAVDTPRYLAHPTANSGDYTEQRHRAIDELEAIDKFTQERYAKKAREHALERRESFERDLEAERKRKKSESPRGIQRAERGRSFRDAA